MADTSDVTHQLRVQTDVIARGLALVATAIAAHGGSIHIDNVEAAYQANYNHIKHNEGSWK